MSARCWSRGRRSPRLLGRPGSDRTRPSTAGSDGRLWRRWSPDGYYTLRGRATELIISGGFNIYPREIEEAAGRAARRARGRRRRRARRGAARCRWPMSSPTAAFDPDARREPSARPASPRSRSPRAVRARRRAAPQRPGQGAEAPAASGQSAMTPAVLSLVALLIAIVLSCTSRVNVGVLAAVFAWLIGNYAPAPEFRASSPR